MITSLFQKILFKINWVKSNRKNKFSGYLMTQMSPLPLKQNNISAIVVNHNGGQDVVNCLKALKVQTFPLDSIIVVDNASTDGSQANILTEFPDVELIQLERNFGPSKARNIGLQHAQTELVLLIDDDVYLHPECIRILYETYDQYRPDVVCPRIVFYPDDHVIQCDGAEVYFIGTLKLRHTLEPAIGYASNPVEVNACISACLLVHRQHALSAGGFDEEFFFYFEDLEFSLRMRILGYSIMCAPQAIALHDRGKGTSGLSFREGVEYPEKRVFYMIRNRLMTILIHYQLKTLIILSPAFAIYEISAIIMMLTRGWLGVWRHAIVSVFNNRKYILSRRKWIQDRRLRGDKDLLSGGSLPVAKGLAKNSFENKYFSILSMILNYYWFSVQRKIR
jgi:hypothetical protein